jgi:hypothetical protein
MTETTPMENLTRLAITTMTSEGKSFPDALRAVATRYPNLAERVRAAGLQPDYPADQRSTPVKPKEAPGRGREKNNGSDSESFDEDLTEIVEPGDEDEDNEDQEDEEDDEEAADRKKGARMSQKMAALDEMEKRATTLARNSGGRLTKSQAYAQVLSQNPNLYQEYEEERDEAMHSASTRRKYFAMLQSRMTGMGLGAGRG